MNSTSVTTARSASVSGSRTGSTVVGSVASTTRTRSSVASLALGASQSLRKITTLSARLSRITSTGFSSDAFKTEGNTHDEFKYLDKARKNLLQTQACDGTWRLLLSISPSVLPYVLLSLDWWLSISIYVCGRLCLKFGLIDTVDLGEFKGLHTMGFVLALMLNFYLNMCVSRLFETNKDAMNMIRLINEFSQFVRGYLWDTPEQIEAANRCVDYFTASHALLYIGFADPYTTENLWMGFNEEFGVLTEKEESYVFKHREVGGSRMRECMTWIMQELHLAVAKGWIPPPIAGGVNNMLAQFSDNAQALFDFRYMPIPFVSEHLLVFFIHVYLPIQTFEMAMQTELLQKDKDVTTKMVVELFGCILALLANMGFQGLFSCGAFLESPYGERITHARVSTYCRLACKEARKTLAAGNPRTNELPMEAEKRELATLRARLGCPPQSKAFGTRVLRDMVDQWEREAVAPTMNSETSC